MAGREGLIETPLSRPSRFQITSNDVSSSTLEGIRVHYDQTVRGSDSSVYQFHYGGDALDVTKQKHLYQFEFSARNSISLINRYQPRSVMGLVNDVEALEYMKKVIKKSTVRPDKHTGSKRDKYAPALSVYSPVRYLGSTSEKFAEAVQRYIKTNPDDLLKSKKKTEFAIKKRHPPVSVIKFRMLMNVKYMRSLVDPGEAVGLLASQG